MKGDVETYHQDGEWKNKIEGEAEPLGTGYATKADAAAEGRKLAIERKVEHFIRNLDGTIGERNTYTGHDPRNIPG
ncbi:DUF2188 domain-containing protein [Amycolatopsis sp. TNS106]|uniref:DUF2188 domain-containing protein n=1 Tax=Amycolatopsis sp. TNS106 TaxID=2861750 RepID=UPI001C571486|nr:DUF2188 domain-containing protein [Amycolatopsis sp. TNS106]QXV57446.1 hypothetical protein CVV72_10885 [Amycolatopsis sp. TNS106]